MGKSVKKDLVIVGGGPAGLSAAIYAQRAMLDNVVLEQEAVGGQVILTSEVDNYPGVPHVDGFTLVDTMQKQAQDLGAAIQMENVEKIERDGGGFLVRTPEHDYLAPTVIVAGGATPRHAGFQGEAEFSGHGVSYCATCDGMFYRGKRVFVVGGGNSAAEEALFLTRFAERVTMVVRKDHLRAQAAIADEIAHNQKVEILFNTTVRKVAGDGLLEEITLRDETSGNERTEKFEKGAFGVFVFVGRVPASELLGGLAKLDDQGYIVTDERMQTSAPGLFAAGDVRQKPLRQIVTAVADGAIAATSAASYLGQPIEG